MRILERDGCRDGSWKAGEIPPLCREVGVRHSIHCLVTVGSGMRTRDGNRLPTPGTAHLGQVAS